MTSPSEFESLSRAWFEESCNQRYSYRWTWLGLPIIQYPQDIVAMQELIWSIKPDLIVETGIAHGGSLVFYASLLELIGGDGMVVGIDIDIRTHNRIRIEEHPLFKRIRMMEGSSIDPSVVQEVQGLARGSKRVLVSLDSNHTHDHVLAELKAYAPLVTADSYLVVFDTVIEDLPEGFFPDRPWERGNNPMTAVHQFIRENSDFEIDSALSERLQVSVAPNGYLNRTRRET